MRWKDPGFRLRFAEIKLFGAREGESVGGEHQGTRTNYLDEHVQDGGRYIAWRDAQAVAKRPKPAEDDDDFVIKSYGLFESSPESSNRCQRSLPLNIAILGLQDRDEIANIIHRSDFFGCESNPERALDLDYEIDVVKRIPVLDVLCRHLGIQHEILVLEDGLEHLGKLLNRHLYPS
jgi:hypothetical protein